MKNISNTWDNIKNDISNFLSKLNVHLFKIGEKDITLGTIFYTIIATLILFIVANWIKKLLDNRLLNSRRFTVSTRQTISTFTKYIIIVVGLTIIIPTAGFDLTSLGVLAGALGVGIGFGLQGIANNFISGIIILLESPIRVGDRIEVGTGTNNISGDVIKISGRATTVLTNDNIAIIVPNSHFTSNTVVNWSHNDRKIRLQIPIGVSYKEDPRLVRKMVLEVISENDGVLKTPKPDLLFKGFGDSSLDFILVVWTTKYIVQPMFLESQLYYAIFKKFKQVGIEIPYPQRDLHIKSSYSDNISAMIEKEKIEENKPESTELSNPKS